MFAALYVLCATPGQSQTAETSAEIREHVAAMSAHHLCAGVFVVGRDYQRSPEQVLAEDITRFPAFNWQDDFQYEVDFTAKTAAVWGEGIPKRLATYDGDQGCTILAAGETAVLFEPVHVARNMPNPGEHPWPTGDVGAYGEFSDVDRTKLDAALDWAMDQGQNTRGLVVSYRGKIIGERYETGFTKNTPQISWSQGKSITAALIGVLVQQGHFGVDDQAPVDEWHQPGDPRSEIKLEHLLRMSSGLDFQNYGLNRSNSWLNENEHFRIYFDAIDVFEHAVQQPQEIPPASRFRYRNSDPLTLGRIVRQTVEQHGGEYLTFPQRELFDRIGARNFVLEPDAWGNFILTGYDFGSTWDWMRFGLLHLWDGVWEGERILPEGWVEFISTPAPGDPQRSYGGLFWLNRGGSYDRVPEDAFWAAGFMGQTTMIIPSRDVVVVRLGPSPGGFGQYFNEIVGRVLDAISSDRVSTSGR